MILSAVWPRARAWFEQNAVSWKGAVLAAALVALGFPPFDLWPLTWIGYGYFLWQILQVAPGRASSKRVGLFFFVYSFAVTLFGFYWLGYTLHEFGALSWPVAAIATLAIFALTSALSFLFGWAWPRLAAFVPLRWLPLALAFWTLVLDSIDLRLFPWSVVQANGVDVTLLASVYWLGTMGWRVLFFGAGAFFIARPSRSRAVVALVVPLAIGYACGFGARASLEKRYPARQPVTLLQGNIGNYEKKLSKLGVMPTVLNVLRIHDDLIGRVVAEHPPGPKGSPEPWIFWPETSFPGFPTQDPMQRDWMRRQLDRTRGLHILGAYESGDVKEGDRTLRLDFNVVALFHESVGPVDLYRKRVLLPFGEFIPCGDSCPSLYRLLPAVNHFGRGEEFRPLAHPDPQGPVFVPLVCYEVLFPSFVRGFVKEAAQRYPGRPLILVNPANDSWYGPTSEPSQHSLLARWEVAKQGIPMLRPTNTGLSQVIAPWGEVLSQGPSDETTFISGELPVERVQLLQ